MELYAQHVIVANIAYLKSEIDVSIGILTVYSLLLLDALSL